MVSGCLFDRGQFISKKDLRSCTVGSLHGSSIQPEHPLFRRNHPLFRRKSPQHGWNCELSTYFLRFWWCYHDLSRVENINIASGSRSRSQVFESPDPQLSGKSHLDLRDGESQDNSLLEHGAYPLWHVGLSWEDFVGQNLLHPRLDAEKCPKLADPCLRC